MRRCSDLEPFQWIAQATSGSAPAGVAVSECVPPVFEAYLKLLHPVYEDLSVADRELSWDQAEGAAEAAHTDEAVGALLGSSVLVRGRPEGGFPSRRVRWAELAERYGVPLTPEVSAWCFSRRFPQGSWPRYLVGPEEGNVEPELLQPLLEVLRAHRPAEQVYFRWDVIATTACESDLLYVGELEELLGIASRVEAHGSPTHWWPADRSWCVCTDWDLTFSLLGGSAELIGDVAARWELESVALTPRTRVDRAAAAT